MICVQTSNIGELLGAIRSNALELQTLVVPEAYIEAARQIFETNVNVESFGT